MRPPPAHRATSAHLQCAYPFQSEGRLADGRGTYIGADLFGGAFVFDPWVLYEARALTSPNVLVFGQIGRGKSSLVKTFVWRSLAFGRRAVILDPKGEYGPLAAACGVRPIRLEPGGAARLNPLDLGLDGGPTANGAAARKRLALVQSIAGSSLDRPLAAEERTAIERALGQVSAGRGAPTLPRLVDALLRPSETSAKAVATEVTQLAAASREVALELRRLCRGDLRGMFDGPTNVRLDAAAPLTVIDLSAVYRSDALGVLMTCAAAWLQGALAGSESGRRLVIVDEAWAILASLPIAAWLQSSFKLSRAFGVANVAVLHRVSDLLAAGGADSRQVRLAEGLLADAEVRVIYAQSPAEVSAAHELLGLTGAEAELLPQLRSGVALWKIGARSFLVEHRLGSSETGIIDTDGRMTMTPGREP